MSAATVVVVERVRLAVFAFLGPAVSWLSFEGLLGPWLAPTSLAVAAIGYTTSRAAVLRDHDVAEAVYRESGPVFFFEALFLGLLTLAAVTHALGAPAPTGASWGAAAAAVVGVALYVWRLSVAAGDSRDVMDEAKLVRRVELGSLALETAMVTLAYSYLDLLRQEGIAMASDHPLGDVLFVPLLLMVVLGPAYAVLIRLRMAVTEAHLRAEVAMMLSGFYAFMLTPPPGTL